MKHEVGRTSYSSNNLDLTIFLQAGYEEKPDINSRVDQQPWDLTNLSKSIQHTRRGQSNLGNLGKL